MYTYTNTDKQYVFVSGVPAVGLTYLDIFWPWTRLRYISKWRWDSTMGHFCDLRPRDSFFKYCYIHGISIHQVLLNVGRCWKSIVKPVPQNLCSNESESNPTSPRLFTFRASVTLQCADDVSDVGLGSVWQWLHLVTSCYVHPISSYSVFFSSFTGNDLFDVQC